MLLLVVSLLLGVVSHIVWDLFTHEARWGTTAIPALAAEWGPLPGYKWLQHGSSVDRTRDHRRVDARVAASA